MCWVKIWDQVGIVVCAGDRIYATQGTGLDPENRGDRFGDCRQARFRTKSPGVVCGTK